MPKNVSRGARRRRLNRLVADCRNQQLPNATRNHAAEQITVVLQRIAWRVNIADFNGSFDSHTLEDVVQTTICKLLDETKYSTNDRSGSLLGWAWTVIRHEFFDRLRRREQVRPGPDDEDALEELVPDSRETWGNWFQQPFPDPDLKKLEAIQPARDRLIVVAYMGLHRKVPQMVWHRWCQQAGVTNFPPPQIAGFGPERGMAKTIASALGIRQDVVHQVVCRKGGVLRELAAIRDLRY